jgi:uncharacterized protein
MRARTTSLAPSPGALALLIGAGALLASASLAVGRSIPADSGGGGSGDTAGASITASGSGDLLVAPDRAVFVIMVDSDAASAATAGADNARIHAAVIAALMKAGARPDQLSSIGYSLEPRPQYNLNGPPQPPTYRVTSSIRVEMSRLDQLGAWIDAALMAGATRIGQIQFEPKDPEGARQQALALAVRNAHADADAMARAAGGALGPLEELSTQAASPRPIGPMLPLPAVAAANRAAEPTEILPPELRIEAIVTGRWGYRAESGAR